MKKKTASKPPTRKAFARRLGISRQALEHHMKNPTAPPLGDVPGWNAHLVIHGKLAALPPKMRDALGVEKAKKRCEQARLLTVDPGEL